MLVENEYFHAIGRAVRYAMLSDNGYSNHIMSLSMFQSQFTNRKNRYFID